MADEGEEGGGPRRPLYTPHLKRVLKSYQAAATTSLHGPDGVLGRGEPGPFVAPPPAPIQQPPLFAPPDPGGGPCERSGETALAGEPIHCFRVGGEERLCLPQILNSVLRAFSLHQINGVCDSLHIFCSRCNAGQLAVLKAEGVLPPSAPSCGLITKSDAERLCAALLEPRPPRPPHAGPFRVPGCHECFGRCRGRYAPELYREPGARCIQCAECRGVLSPQGFVCHAHPPGENRTCHWGFDSLRWRSYLLLDEEDGPPDPLHKEALRQMKSRFDYNHKFKRKQILSESCDVAKRAHVDPSSLVCWYGGPLWPARPEILDGKLYLAGPDAAALFKDRLDASSYVGPVGRPVTLAYHVREERKDDEGALSDTSFSTLSAGTEDGGPLEEGPEEVEPGQGEELGPLQRLLEEVAPPLGSQILAEVESLLAKYRKCLAVAVQGKKLYQAELEKFNYVQRGKIRKLRETNKYLEKKMRRLQREESGEPPPSEGVSEAPPGGEKCEEEAPIPVATEDA